MPKTATAASRSVRSPKSPTNSTSTSISAKTSPKAARVTAPKSEKIAIVRPKSAPKAATKLNESAQLSLENSVTNAANANGTPKAKRTRVPANFAETYGENRKERKEVAALPAVEKKRRKTAKERADLQRLMTPDDDIFQRLARSAPSIPSRSSRKGAVKLRKFEWESRCGKCGFSEVFATPAALCSRCGAIAVRVLD